MAGARTAPAPSALRLAPVRNLHTFRVILNTALLLGGSTQQVQATLLGRTHTVLNAAKSVLDILSQLTSTYMTFDTGALSAKRKPPSDVRPNDALSNLRMEILFLIDSRSFSLSLARPPPPSLPASIPPSLPPSLSPSLLPPPLPPSMAQTALHLPLRRMQEEHGRARQLPR